MYMSKWFDVQFKINEANVIEGNHVKVICFSFRSEVNENDS